MCDSVGLAHEKGGHVMKIGKRIKGMRVKNGLTKDEMAVLLTVPSSTVRKWEADKMLPDFEHVKAMHQVMDVSIDELLDEC